MTYGHGYNWAILIAIALAGALIRVFFVSRHGEGKTAYIPAAAAVVLVAVVAAAIVPRSSATSVNAGVSFADVQNIITQRCTVCHASSPTQPGFTSPPKGVVYDTTEQIQSQASIIHQQAVVSKAMPIGNLTQMTEDERKMIAEWFSQLSDQGD